MKKVLVGLLFVFALVGDAPRAKFAKTNLATPLTTPAAAAATTNIN